MELTRKREKEKHSSLPQDLLDKSGDSLTYQVHILGEVNRPGTC